MNDPRFVLDASALLALMLAEPGASAVATRLPESIICAVNLCEVVTKLIDRGIPIDMIESGFADLRIQSIALDHDLAIRAGLLRAAARGRGLSLGDRACLALAQAHGAVAVTADRARAEVNAGVAVEVIR